MYVRTYDTAKLTDGDVVVVRFSDGDVVVVRFTGRDVVVVRFTVVIVRLSDGDWCYYSDLRMLSHYKLI